MAEVTEADRERAMRALGVHPTWAPEDLSDVTREITEHIAAALAEERERARAPFLALAEELEDLLSQRQYAATGSYDDGLRRAQANAADHIRRAAEDAR